MKKYFYGDFVFNEDYKCEVVETWEYNENEEFDDDKWELLDTYPLTKGYEDIYFEQFPNITPSSEYYMFCEISKDDFKKMKEDYAVYERLLKEGKKVDAECKLRIADQEYGYADGIRQALVCIGFRHERMIELDELL